MIPPRHWLLPLEASASVAPREVRLDAGMLVAGLETVLPPSCLQYNSGQVWGILLAFKNNSLSSGSGTL